MLGIKKKNKQANGVKQQSILRFMNYLNSMLKSEYVLNMALKVRSSKDLDIIIEVLDEGHKLPVLSMIEANIYTKQLLETKQISRGDKVMSILNIDDSVIKIFVYTPEEYSEITLDRAK